MTEDTYVRRDLRGDRIAGSDLEVGDTVVFKWSAFGWATENEGHSGAVKATVDRIEAMGDIKLITDAGHTLKVLKGRSEVMGDAQETDGVPDWTDVGRGGTFYEVNDR